MHSTLKYKYKALSAAVLLVIALYCLTSKVYRLPLSYGDDHRALAMLHPNEIPASYKATMGGHAANFKESFAIDWARGRFRPLSWTYEKLLCLVSGDDIFLRRLSNLFVLFFSIFFLFNILSLLKVDFLSALIVMCIYVFGKQNETWWALIPPNQSIGECFMLAGIWAWLYLRSLNKADWYVVPFILFLVASLIKESFMFSIPVLLLADHLFLSPHKKVVAKEYVLSFLAFFIPFLCLIFTLLHSGRVYGYVYPESALHIALYNAFQFCIASCFFVAPIVAVILGRKSLDKQFVIRLVGFLLLWLAVQLALLKGIKMDEQHHYLIPGLWLLLIVSACALFRIKQNSKWVYSLVMIVYALFALLFAKNTYVNSSAFSASVKAYYAMVDSIKKSPAPTTVYLSGYAFTNDWINGTAMIFSHEKINTSIYFATTLDSIPTWQSEHIKRYPQTAYPTLAFKDVFKPDGRWIILVDNPAWNGMIQGDISFSKQNGEVYITTNGQRTLIDGKYYYFNMPYNNLSLRDIIRGDFKVPATKGFYAVKMNNRVR